MSRLAEILFAGATLLVALTTTLFADDYRARGDFEVIKGHSQAAFIELDSVDRSEQQHYAIAQKSEPGRPVLTSTPDKGLVLRVQQLLTVLGHNPGLVDGVLGPKTRKAVEDFQRHHGIPTNGQVSTSLVSRLEAARFAAAKPELVETARSGEAPEDEDEVVDENWKLQFHWTMESDWYRASAEGLATLHIDQDHRLYGQGEMSVTQSSTLENVHLEEGGRAQFTITGRRRGDKLVITFLGQIPTAGTLSLTSPQRVEPHSSSFDVSILAYNQVVERKERATASGNHSNMSRFQLPDGSKEHKMTGSSTFILFDGRNIRSDETITAALDAPNWRLELDGNIQYTHKDKYSTQIHRQRWIGEVDFNAAVKESVIEATGPLKIVFEIRGGANTADASSGARMSYRAEYEGTLELRGKIVGKQLVFVPLGWSEGGSQSASAFGPGWSHKSSGADRGKGGGMSLFEGHPQIRIPLEDGSQWSWEPGDAGGMKQVGALVWRLRSKADACVADPSEPAATDDAMRLAALFASASGAAPARKEIVASDAPSRPAEGEQIGAELIDEMRASLERGFRTMITSMSNEEIIERAQRLNDMLFEDNIGPKEKSAIAETLLDMHNEMAERITHDRVGLPDAEGVEWQPDDPTAGIVENVPPFGMVDWWNGFILPDSDTATRQRKGERPSVEHLEFTDEIVEVRPEPSADQLLQRAVNAVERSGLPWSGRSVCLLQKLRDSAADDRIVQANRYLWINQPSAIFCGDPDAYTYRIRKELIERLRRAKNPEGLVAAAERTFQIVHETYQEAIAIHSKGAGQGGGSALNEAQVKLKAWVAQRQREGTSIYSCWVR